MSNNTAILTEVTHDNRGVITFNRPDIHNAFDDQFIECLTQEILTLEENEDVRLLVLKANGKSFSAGADLNWMRRMADYSWEENHQDSLKLAKLMQTLYECKKPTIALVEGAAFGGGVGLVACCDIALASERALFCLSEVKLGLIPAVISPYVIKAIGAREAQRFFLTAERFNANEARSMGLIHQVSTTDDFQEKANGLINQLLANGPQATREAKSLIRLVEHSPHIDTLFSETAKRIADIRASEEGKEGVGAFLEKRQPNWLSQKDN